MPIVVSDVLSQDVTVFGNRDQKVSGALREVFFDNLKITHTHSPIVSADDYYPFGLQIKQNAYQRESAISQKYKFGKQEFQDELGLNWYHYKFRFHDPAVGRFFSIDPLADSYVYNSPYAFAENKLGLGVELEGLELVTWDQLKAGAEVAGNFLNGFANAVSSNSTTLTNPTGESVSLVDRVNSSDPGFSTGQTAGDAFSLLQGGVEVVGGAVVATSGTVGGVVTSPTGVGAVVGGAVAVGGLAVATHGGNTFINALDNLLNNKRTVNADGNSKGSSTKQNTKGQGKESTSLEKSQEQLDGIEGAQQNAKKQKKGQKQNKIQSTKKSKQNFKNELKRIDIREDLDGNGNGH